MALNAAPCWRGVARRTRSESRHNSRTNRPAMPEARGHACCEERIACMGIVNFMKIALQMPPLVIEADGVQAAKERRS